MSNASFTPFQLGEEFSKILKVQTSEIEQSTWIDSQCLGNSTNNLHRWIATSGLDAADIGGVELGLVGQLFLRKTALFAQASDVLPE